jgi:hypothetical protein
VPTNHRISSIAATDDASKNRHDSCQVHSHMVGFKSRFSFPSTTIWTLQKRTTTCSQSPTHTSSSSLSKNQKPICIPHFAPRLTLLSKKYIQNFTLITVMAVPHASQPDVHPILREVLNFRECSTSTIYGTFWRRANACC